MPLSDKSGSIILTAISMDGLEGVPRGQDRIQTDRTTIVDALLRTLRIVLSTSELSPSPCDAGDFALPVSVIPIVVGSLKISRISARGYAVVSRDSMNKRLIVSAYIEEIRSRRRRNLLGLSMYASCIRWYSITEHWELWPTVRDRSGVPGCVRIQTTQNEKGAKAGFGAIGLRIRQPESR